MTASPGCQPPAIAIDLEPSVTKGSDRIVSAPARWILGWLGLTLLLWFVFLSGSAATRIGLTLFVAIAGMAAIRIGYQVGTQRLGPAILGGTRTPKFREGSPFVGAIVLLGSGYLILRGYTNLSILSSNGLAVGTAVDNSQLAYQARQNAFGLQDSGTSGGVVLASLLNYASILGVVAVPAAVLRWRSLSFLTRSVFATSVFAYAASWGAVGTVSGTANILLELVLAAGILVARGKPATRTANVQSPPAGRFSVAKVVAVAALGLIVVLATLALGSRVSSLDRGVDGAGGLPPHALTALVGETVATGSTVLVSYVSQGYSGLSASLTQPFVWTAGSGSSPGLNRVVPFLNSEVNAANAYPFRAEIDQGWPALGKWQTIYPWLASDLTFPGAIFFVGCIGMLFAAAWVTALGRGGLLAASWFVQLGVILVSVPLNNQPIAATPNVVAFGCLIAATLWSVIDSSLAGKRGRSSQPAQGLLSGGVKPTHHAATGRR